MPPSPTDTRHLDHAEGYVELGMLADAVAELDPITPEHQSEPDVLSVRLDVAMRGKAWEEAVRIGRILVEAEPDNPDWLIQLAYATRRAESVSAACLILMGAEERFPRDGMIQFNLGCYAAQLGNVEAAKVYVEKAVEIDGAFRKLAMEDEDLVGIRGHFVAVVAN